MGRDDSSAPLQRPKISRPRILACLATVALLLLIAGCGSSGGSGTIGVGNENTGDEALAKPSGGTATTPTSGPLATEPTIARPTGAAPTKLETKDLVVGSGPEAKAGESVTVNYVGELFKNGKVFDASWKRKEPFTFVLGKGQVITGWDKGIVGMKVGGRRELIIPAPLAYGANGTGAIPPNSALVFVVDLLGV